MTDQIKNIAIRVPDSLRLRIRVAAAKEDKSINAWVVNLIERELKDTER